MNDDKENPNPLEDAPEATISAPEAGNVPAVKIVAPEAGNVQAAKIIAPEAGRLSTSEDKEAYAHKESMQIANLGWVGRIWGAKSEKPGNVSAMVLLIFSLILGIFIFTLTDSEHFQYIFSGMTSIITLILGYLFGSSDRN